MRAFAEEPWEHPQKIILGIDIGTTHSAVSFAFLYPGGPQSLRRVTKWPGQDSQRGECKTPTIVYYDESGKAVSFGVEAAKITSAEAEDQGWRLARYFKLHLHPKAMRQKHNVAVQPLPDGIPLEKIYADFMIYLMQHTQATFESHVVEGAKCWKELRDDMTIVLAHPNGWTIQEQNLLRQAAIAAEYTTEARGHAQIHFVSEAEASMHFCMFESDIHRRLEPGVGLIVCDAGGSTVDTTAYRVKNTSPVLELEEVKASACIQAGGVFVDMEFERHLRSILSGVDLDEDERDDYIQNGVKDFEASAKQSFGLKGSDGASRETIQNFFDTRVTEIIRSVRQQTSGFNPEHILLVGGFGDSPHLRHKLLSEFDGAGCSVTIANDSTSKAVADGTVIWSTKLSVIRRATRMPYGIAVSEPYSSQNPNHAGRIPYKQADGINYVRGCWAQIVGKGIVMGTAEATRQLYSRLYKDPNPRLDRIAQQLFAWTNDGELPNEWLYDKHNNHNKGYENICEVKADLSGMSKALKKEYGLDGDYYRLDFFIALQFGGTELKAFIEWEENGKTRTGPASILPSALTIVRN